MAEKTSPLSADRPVAKGPISVKNQLLAAQVLGLIPLALINYLLVGLSLTANLVSLAGYVLASVLTLILFSRGFEHPSLGSANLVTLFRLVVVAALLAAVIESAYAWLIVVLAVSALVLDGVDGYLARSRNRVSAFGARFDMEVDTALAATLAVIAFSQGLIGAWVLLLAMPRYLFVIAAKISPWLSAQLPYSLFRRVVSVIQITALIVVNAPLFEGLLVLPAALIGLGLLGLSFGKDVIWLWQNRG